MARVRRHLLALLIVLLGATRCPPPDNQTPPPVHTPIPPVLDGVIAAAMQPPRDLRPPLPDLGYEALDEDALVRADRFVVQAGLEVLVVALAALLGGAGADELRDADPVEGALGVHELGEVGVFGLGPGPASVGRHAGGGRPGQVCVDEDSLSWMLMLGASTSVRTVAKGVAYVGNYIYS